jgi:hypothetical protein
MKTLKLTIEKQWFDMIDSGIKREEYREIKPFWIKRLCNPSIFIDQKIPVDRWTNEVTNVMHPHTLWWIRNVYYDILFANGGHFGNVPKLTVKWDGMHIGEGRPEWGAEPGKKYFVIKLGDKI